MAWGDQERTAGGLTRSGRSRVLWILLGLAGLALALAGLQYYADTGGLAADAHAYWLTGQDGYIPYSVPADYVDAYLYPPAFAQLVKPLTLLPWVAFASLWILMEVAALLWLLRPLGWLPAAVLILWCSPELLLGNVNALIAVAVVVALTRSSAAWAFTALTKPPLAIGALWHVFRRDWRAVGVAAGTTGLVVAVSFAIDPAMWRAWVDFVVGGSGDVGPRYYVQLVFCVAIIVFAARSDRAWLVPVALLLANPLIGGVNDFVVLAAIPRLIAPRSAFRTTPTAVPTAPPPG